MSSSEPETLSSRITPSLTIPQLIKLVKHSFREDEFNDVQNILMVREKNIKMEMENLVRDRDLMKEEVRLLERTQGLAELEKLKFEEKLQMSQRKCEELKETITMLTEEQRVSDDREKRMEERYNKVCEENSKIANEKNKMIFELNEKITELKNKNLDSERLVGVYQEKFKCSETRHEKMDKEIKDLRHERLAADQTVKRLRQKQLESDQIVENLRRQNLEATQTLNELRLKKLESDKAAELNKSRLENLAPRIMRVEEALANMLDIKVEDLADLVDDMGTSAAAEEGGNVNFPDSKGEKDGLGNGSTHGGWNADAENVLVTSPGVYSTCNSTGSGCIGLSNKGSRNLVQASWTKEDGAYMVQTSPVAQSDGTDQDNESKGLQGSGPHASDTGSDGGVPVKEQLMFGPGRPNKMPSSSSASRYIIEISDSDDETNPGGAAYISDVCANVGENKMVFEKFVHSPSSSQTNKRNRTGSRESSLKNLTPKRKKSIQGSDVDSLPIHEKENQVLESTHDRIGSLNNGFLVNATSASTRCDEKARAACGSQTPLQKLNGFNDGESTDSEDGSCSDSHMDDFVSTLRRKKLSRTWMFGADMLQAFQEDAELCMNAVCALYRQQIFAAKSTQGSSLSKSGGFSPVDAMSGRALAEYLIDGDPELRLRKSVSEVKQQRPDVLSQCKRLSTIYHEKLYEIYCYEVDPFFRAAVIMP